MDSAKKATYLSDLRRLLDAMEYGDTTVRFKRVKNRTVEMITDSVETAKHTTNEEYLTDLVLLVKALAQNEHSGVVRLELDWKKGTINTLGIHTETKKEYRK